MASLSTARATFKVIFGFITTGIFLAHSFFFSRHPCQRQPIPSNQGYLVVPWDGTVPSEF